MAALRAATRGSALARWQTDRVIELLDVEVEIVIVETSGDKRQDVPIAELGGRGVFVKEVQAAVLEGRADIAVHSAKDLPSITPDGLILAAVPEREDPRDALVGSTLAGLPQGGRVGTGAVRRQALLAAARPDLQFASLRGNIDTRLAKAAEFDAIVMAVAALRRLHYQDRIAEILDTTVMLPQVAQGALAVECRSDDISTQQLLSLIDDELAHSAVTAERAFLATLGGGCDLPVGALARPGHGRGELVLDALIAAVDGSQVVRGEATGTDPELLGRSLADRLLAEGGAALLAARTDR